MISAQGVKRVIVKNGAVTNATNATSSHQVDCTGFKWATIRVISTPATATNSADKFSVLSLNEGNATGTTYTIISDFTGTTNSSATAGFVIQTNTNTSVGSEQVFQVNMAKRQPVLTVLLQCAASHSNPAIVAELSRAEEWPNSTTEAGAFYVVG